MNFGQAIVSGLRNYFKFSGRASRSEFWYFQLFFTLVIIVADILDFFLFRSLVDRGLSPIAIIIQLALFVPDLAISVRRLHDLDRKGWWFLLVFTGIGGIVLLVWDCKKGTTGKNRFGEDPLAYA